MWNIFRFFMYFIPHKTETQFHEQHLMLFEGVPMKKLMIVSALAMCLGVNAFAEDDGYGNDIPPARQEGTVDDGYGNKLPEYGQSTTEYKSYGEARSSSGNSSEVPLRFGVHFAVGLGSYWDYPSELEDYLGKNEWIGVTFDLGGVFKYRVNSLLSIVPELNLGFNYTAREVDRGSTRDYHNYRVDEVRTLFNINIPLTLRLTPMPNLYVEAGGRVSFNLGTSHSGDYFDENGESIPNSEIELEKWEVKTFVPSIVAGLGGSIGQFDFGARLILDVGGIEKHDKVEDVDDNGNAYMIENNTKNWTIQLLVNYYIN